MLFSFPLGVPKAPLRPLGNDSSLPCLSPDLDGVQLFRIHCQAAAVVCVCAYVLGLLSFPLGVPKVPLRPLGNDRFLLCLSPDLDGVQPFRIHCQAAAVVCVCAYVLGLLSFPLGVPKVPLRPLGNDRFLLCLSSDPLPSGCRCVRLCLRTGPLVFSSRGSKGATSAPGE